MRYLLTNLPLALGEETLAPAGPLSRVLGGRPEEYRGVVLERRSLDARHNAGGNPRARLPVLHRRRVRFRLLADRRAWTGAGSAGPGGAQRRPAKQKPIFLTRSARLRHENARRKHAEYAGDPT